MKKIVIITFYNANNIGAFLQAYALMEVIKKILPNGQVFFGRFPSRKEQDSLISKITRNLQGGNFRKLFYKIRSSSMYREEQRIFPTIDITDDLKADAFILGSDEIWNVSSNKFTHYPQFFGHKLNSSRIIAYAPSAQGLSVNDFKIYAPSENFSDIRFLSARDLKTKETVQTISGRQVEQVIDPTILLSDFTLNLPDCPQKNNFILVYSYELEIKQVNKIKNFADRYNLPIISVGTYCSWADCSLCVTPWLFLSYLKAAKYVITSTFHGTLLSIKYNKNFVCFSSGNGKPNKKVEDVLSCFDLNNRDMINVKSIEKALIEGIDYKHANSLLKENQKSSLMYLKKALGV